MRDDGKVGRMRARWLKVNVDGVVLGSLFFSFGGVEFFRGFVTGV